MINSFGQSGQKVRGQGAFMPFAAPCLNLHNAGQTGLSLRPRECPQQGFRELIDPQSQCQEQRSNPLWRLCKSGDPS